MSTFQYEVFFLDMLPDGDGGWLENERRKIGAIEVECSEQSLPLAILNALRDFTCRDIVGRERHVLTTTDRRRIYVEDCYGTGNWLEVGTRKGHKPFLGLSLIEPH